MCAVLVGVFIPKHVVFIERTGTPEITFNVSPNNLASLFLRDETAPQEYIPGAAPEHDRRHQPNSYGPPNRLLHPRSIR